MSKRKKVQISGTKAGRIKKCKGNSLENSETQIVTPDLKTSSAEEGGKASSERKELDQSKIFLPPSQGGKFKPVFTKPKKLVAERRERDDGKDSAVPVEQSLGVQCIVVPKTAARPFQNTISPSGSLRLMDLLLPKGEDAGDQVILPCEEESEKLDAEMQDQERTGSVNSNNVFHQKMGIANNLHINICEEEMPERQISFILKTSDNEDSEGLKKRDLNFGSLIQKMSINVLAEGKNNDHLKNSQCEEEHLSSSNMGVEQNEAIQDIVKSDYVEERKEDKNGSRDNAGFMEQVASQTQNENNITQPTLLMDLSVLAPEEQSSNLHITGVAGIGSGHDGKGIDHDLHENNENHITQHPLLMDLSVLASEEQSSNLHLSGVAGIGGGHDGKDIDQDPHENNENHITQPPFLMDLSVLAPEEQSSNLHISGVAGIGGGHDGKGIDQDPHENNENHITQPPLLMDLSVLAVEEQSSNLHISNVTGIGNGSDGKGIDQDLLYRSGTTEGQSDIFSSTDILEAGDGGALHNSTVSEYTTDQHRLWTSDKSGEQSSPCRREVIAAEWTISEQDTSRKDFPATQTMCIDLEKEVNIYESKCEHDIETTQAFCPQPDETGHTNFSVGFETRKTSVQSRFYSEDNGPGMIAKPAKKIGTTQEEEIPILFQRQQQWKESECEKLVPDNKQLELDDCNLRHNEIKETFFNASITHQNLTKSSKVETKSKAEYSPDVHVDVKEVEMCAEVKSQPIHVEISLSTNALSQLEKEIRSPIIPNRDFNADSEVQQPHWMSGPDSSICASSDFDHVTQTHSLCKDPLNLEYLTHSQLQVISESNDLEFPRDKPFSPDNQHTHSKGKKDQFAVGGCKGNEPPAPVVLSGLGPPNNARVEKERICDPSEQEDATDVVWGLIKELSNLNRLIMSKHRDLDSFKRLKFRRNRQSGKSLLHGMNNMTSTLCTMKKKEI